MRPAVRARSKGFTLLEVLVALTLFALVGGALLELFQGGLRTSRIAAEHTHATLLARSKLAELEAYSELAPGAWEGDFADGYRWHVTLAPMPEIEAETVVALQPLRLELVVAWGEAGDARSVRTESLLLSSGGAP